MRKKEAGSMIAPDIDRTLEPSTKDLLRVFAGCYEALGLYIHFKTYGDGDYFIRDLVKQSGIGKYKLRKLLDQMAAAGVIKTEVTHGRGLKLELLSEYWNSSSDIRTVVPVQSVPKVAKKAKAPDTTKESRSSLTQSGRKLESHSALTDGTSYGVASASPLQQAASACVSNSDLGLFSSSDPQQLAPPEPAATSDLTPSNQAKEQATKKRVTLPQSVDGSLIKKEAPKKKVKKPRKKAPPKEKTLGAKIWDAYAEEWTKRYGNDPLRNAKTNAIAKRIGELMGQEGVDAIRFYVQSQKASYIADRHPLWLAERKAETVHADWKAGRHIDWGDAKHLEANDYNSRVSAMMMDQINLEYQDPKPAKIVEQEKPALPEPKPEPEFKHAIDFADKPIGQDVSDEELMSGSMGAFLKNCGIS